MTRLVVRRRARRGLELPAPPPPPPLEIADRQRFIKVPLRRLQRAVAAALALKPRRRGPISLVILDDRAIRRIHHDHLGIDEPTDVLSFPLEGAPGGPGSPGGMLGEVLVSAETARREGRARGIAPADELLLYVVHGVLHLLGFDDHAPAARKKMRAAERAALRAVSIRRDLFPSREGARGKTRRSVLPIEGSGGRR